jgi:GNAT superfamily N-acetyltransferase
MNDAPIAFARPVEMPPADADVRALREKLGEFNVHHGAIDRGQRVAIFHHDETGQMVAGIYGWLWGQCLEIVLLWIDEPLRGQGLGSRLLAQMEDAGRQHGARLAMLETFSFQAPGFYQDQGYETFSIIEGYGGRHAKHFMRKALVKA